MGIQAWGQPEIISQADGSAVTGTTIGSILPTGAVWTMPANYLYPGKRLLLKADGRISNIVTTPGTLTLTVRIAGATAVAVSAALQLNAVAKTNVGWDLEWNLTCRAIGSGTSANFMHNGKFLSESVVGSPVPGTGGNGQLMLQPSAPAVGTGFNSAQANTVDLMATFSLSGNSITCHQFALFSLN